MHISLPRISHHHRAIEKALRLGAADLLGLEAQSTSQEYEALRETIPKRHRTTSIRKGSEQSMNESRIQE